MKAWEEELLERKRRDGKGREGKFHLLGYPEDAEYINFLHDWALRASPGRKYHANTDEDSQSNGKVPPYWGEEEHWMRERTPLIKKAARELGAQRRREIRTLKELGFDFEAWKREREEMKGEMGNVGVVNRAPVGEGEEAAE
jgi:hypothetical protein